MEEVKVWVIELVDYVNVYDENERFSMTYETIESFDIALHSFLKQGYHIETYIMTIPADE